MMVLQLVPFIIEHAFNNCGFEFRQRKNMTWEWWMVVGFTQCHVINQCTPLCPPGTSYILTPLPTCIVMWSCHTNVAIDLAWMKGKRLTEGKGICQVPVYYLASLGFDEIAEVRERFAMLPPTVSIVCCRTRPYNLCGYQFCLIVFLGVFIIGVDVMMFPTVHSSSIHAIPGTDLQRQRFSLMWRWIKDCRRIAWLLLCRKANNLPITPGIVLQTRILQVPILLAYDHFFPDLECTPIGKNIVNSLMNFDGREVTSDFDVIIPCIELFLSDASAGYVLSLPPVTGDCRSVTGDTL